MKDLNIIHNLVGELTKNGFLLKQNNIRLEPSVEYILLNQD